MCSDEKRETPRADRRLPSALVLILGLSLILNLTAVWWGLPQSGSWAPDEIFPGRIYDGMSNLFSHGWYDRYPLFHFMLLTPIVFVCSQLYDAGILRLSPTGEHTLILLLMRLVSTAMALGLVYGVFGFVRTILGRRAGLMAAAFAALLVPLPYYAKTANVDVPYLFWFIASLNFLVRALERGRRRDYVLFGVTAALSICTKDQAYGLYLFTPLIVVWNDLRRSRLRGALPSYGWAAAAAAGTFALGNNLIFNGPGFVDHVRLITGAASRDFAAVPASFAGQLKLAALAGKQVRFCLGWPLFLVCLAGLVFVLADKTAPFALKVLPLMALSYHLFYTAVIRYSYDRFQLPVALILTVFGAAAVDRFLGRRKIRWKTALAAALLAFGLFQAVSVDRLMLADSRYVVERWLRAHVPASATIGTATNLEYLPRLDGFRIQELPLSLAGFRDAPGPEFVIFCTAFRNAWAPDSEEGRFFAGFASVSPGYRQVLDAKTDLGLFPLSFEGIGTNLAAISPEIEVFARTDIADGLPPVDPKTR